MSAFISFDAAGSFTLPLSSILSVLKFIDFSAISPNKSWNPCASESTSRGIKTICPLGLLVTAV